MAEHRRCWYQLSLTTCLVMTVVAATLMWANLQMDRREELIQFHSEAPPPTVTKEIDDAGFEVVITTQLKPGPLQLLFWQETCGWPANVYVYQRNLWEDGGSVKPSGVVLNSLVAFFILTAAAFLSENLICRRAQTNQGAEA